MFVVCDGVKNGFLGSYMNVDVNVNVNVCEGECVWDSSCFDTMKA